MVHSIVKEISHRKDYLTNKELTSIYFGGGTPSILQDKHLSEIFNSIHRHFDLSKEAEITFEVNPEDINLSKLEFWYSLGINRLSIGIQSFYQQDLKWMNRIHSVDQSTQALDLVDSFGKMEYSLDLIFGSDTTTNEMWKENLRLATERKPSHISCYALTVEDNTALDHMIKKGSKKESPQEKVKDQFYMAREFLMAAGYEHYEISNYSLPGKNATHNSNYWKSIEYLGIGPSAHSYNKESRSWNLANNAHYLSAIEENKNAEVIELLSDSDKYNEFIMTRLRTKWGIKQSNLENLFSQKFVKHFETEAQILLNQSLLVEEEGTFTLSEKALIIADTVASDLFY